MWLDATDLFHKHLVLCIIVLKETYKHAYMHYSKRKGTTYEYATYLHFTIYIIAAAAALLVHPQ